MPSNILRTAIGSVSVSDSILDLMGSYYIPGDVNAAAQHFPYFKFDPNKDLEFYSHNWWRQPPEVQQAGAKKVLDRFKSWYGQAHTMDKVFLAVAGLTDSSESLENIVSDAYDDMKKKFTITMQDGDDTHFEVEDYHAVRLEENLNAAIFTEKTEWWCRRFEEQFHRVINSPCVPWEQFLYWNNRREEQEHVLSQRFRPYKLYRSSGFTAKQTRRLFNRSLRLFTRMYGENQARKFIKGKNLWLHGKYFVWKLKLEPREIIQDTVSPSQVHTPFTITICDHQLNALCQACVLFSGTPVLDQAVAFGMMIATPEDEFAFLRTSNLYSFTPEGRLNELLTSMPHANVLPPPRRRHEIDEDEDNCEDPYGDPVAFDTTIDDGTDVAADDYDYRDWREEYHFRHEDEEHIDLNDDFETAYGSEYDEPIQSLVNSAVLSSDQRDQMMELYHRWRVEAKQERRARNRHPIIVQLREKLFSKIDVDPEIFRYMRFPEFHFQFLPKVLTAPRLEGWVGARVPLFEKNF